MTGRRGPGVRQRAARPPASLGWRIGALLALVVLAGAATTGVIALAVAPTVFQAHLSMAVTDPIDPVLGAHVDEAFATAVLLSLGVAVPVALGVAFAVSWLIARRLTRAAQAVARAAEQVAAGDYRASLHAPQIGAELTTLTTAFNAMAQRLAQTESTRQRLIGDLAHELRTPVAALEATVDAVCDGVLPADATTMATLHEQTRRLGRLVCDMSAVSRAEERRIVLEPGPVDAATLAARVVAAHTAAYAATGLQLHLDVPPGARVVHVDEQRIAEALGNLIDNAARHAPPGGTVTVTVRASGAWVLIETTDSGTGFEPAQADRLFERFYRTDTGRADAGAHTGVGLTIARALVAAHGGTLTATSRGPGTGATFVIALPRHDG